MKILFLIPPSEGKNKDITNNTTTTEQLSFKFDKPLDIAYNATEKDLKCRGDRYKQGINLNQNIAKAPNKNSKKIAAIYRYSGVMYKSIEYLNMTQDWQKFFEDRFLILSGMYWLVRPLDKIGNYKLPIETKRLYSFWWEKIVDKLIGIKPDYIVNLLPMSYAKMAIVGKWKEKKLSDNWIKIININFLKLDGNKVAHGVKKLRWEWIKKICEGNILDYNNFGGEVLEYFGNKEKNDNNIIDISIVCE